MIVYCNMDELYSCPSLEQILKGFFSTLTGFTNTVEDVSSTVAEVASTVTGVANNVTGVSSTLTGVSTDIMGMSSTLTAVSNDVTIISSILTGVSTDVTGMSSTLTGVPSTCTLAANCSCGDIFKSCQDVGDKCPECTSGYYGILAESFTDKDAYCSFEQKCGTVGPWRRVAYLNMSDSSSVCPCGTQKFVNGAAIACGIQEPSNPICLTVASSLTHSYSEICGQVAGY